MAEIHSSKTNRSPLPVILGIGGLAGGIALTGVAARLLKDNAIWWAALPAALTGYGEGHLAGAAIARSRADHGQHKSEEPPPRMGGPVSHGPDFARLRGRLEQDGELPERMTDEVTRGLSHRVDRSPLASFDPRQKELENLSEMRKETEAKLAESEAQLQASLDEFAAQMFFLDVFLRHYDKVKKALDTGRFDPSAINNTYTTALGHAVREGDVRMVTLLLPYAQDVNRVCDGKTAIHHAIWADHAEICQLLFEKGALLSDTDRWEGKPYLHIAVLVAGAKTLETIVDHVENIDVTDEEGWTAAKLAASSDDTRLLEILLAHGSRLQRTDFSDMDWEVLTPEIREKIQGAALTEHMG